MKCLCGCGGDAPKGGKFIRGHNLKVKEYRGKRDPDTYVNKPPAVYLAHKLTDEQIRYLRKHYNGRNRKELSRKLGIPRLYLNFIVMELKLSKEVESA